MERLAHKWNSIKIWSDTYEDIILLKSHAEASLKKNLSIAQTVDAIVWAEIINLKEGSTFWSKRARKES